MPFVFLLLPDLAEALIATYADHKSLVAIGGTCQTMVGMVRTNYITAVRLPSMAYKEECDDSRPPSASRRLLRVSSLFRQLKCLRRVNVGWLSPVLPGLLHAIEEGSCKGLREIEVYEESDPLYEAMASDPLTLLPYLQNLLLKDDVGHKYSWDNEQEEEMEQEDDGDAGGGDNAVTPLLPHQVAHLPAGPTGSSTTVTSGSGSNASPLMPLHQLLRALGDGGFPCLRSLRINLGDDRNWDWLLQALTRVSERYAGAASVTAGGDIGSASAFSFPPPAYLDTLSIYRSSQHFANFFALEACAHITSINIDEIEQDGLDALADYVMRRFGGQLSVDVDATTTSNATTNNQALITPPIKKLFLMADEYESAESIHFLPPLFSPRNAGGAYLEELHLDNIGFPPEQLGAAFRQDGFGRNLRKLELRDCGGSNEDGYGLSVEFLSQASSALMTQPHGFPLLTRLSFRGDAIDSVPAIVELAQGLSQPGMMPALRELELRALHMGDQGLVALADAWQNGAPCGSSIRLLDLRNNQFGEPASPSLGVAALSRCMARGCLPLLEELQLEGNRGSYRHYDPDGIDTNNLPTYKGKRGINDTNVLQLLAAFHAGAGQHLRALSLEYTSFTAMSILPFEQALCRREICPRLCKCPFSLLTGYFKVSDEVQDSIKRIKAFLKEREDVNRCK